MRSVKLLMVLAVTIICFLLLLYFRVSFGIALAVSMAVMWGGVRYVRQNNPYEDDREEASSDTEEK